MLICFVFWFNGQEWSSMPLFQITTLTAASHWMHEQSRDSAEAAQKQCESKVKTVCAYCAVIATAIISHSWCVACVMKIREFALLLTLNENEVTIITSRMFVFHVVQVVDWRKVITIYMLLRLRRRMRCSLWIHSPTLVTWFVWSPAFTAVTC